MKLRRGNIAISLIIMAALGLAGCGDGGRSADLPADPATSAPTSDARQAFTAATANLTRQPVKFDMAMADLFSVRGRIDPAGRKAEISGQLTRGGDQTSLQSIAIGDDVWLKIGGIPESEWWMHTTAGEVEGTTLDLANPENPGGVMTMINAVNHVERDGASGFKGTIDLRKSPTVTADAIAKLGDKLKAVPFTATVFDDGNLKTFVVDLNLFIPGARMTASYGGYGVPFEVQAPAPDEVMEIPARYLTAIKS